MVNSNLTSLSLDLGHICFAIVLMPFVPALEHFEVRLHDVYNGRSAFKPEFLQKRKWPTKVKSLRFIAYDQYMNTASFCAFVQRFSLSLEHLSFYMSTHERYLMSTHCNFEHYLLDYLPHLKQIDFCVSSGVMNVEIDRREKFDHWTKRQVISIFHYRKFHTRFTLPFTFDRLEHISNEFVDYHCNFYQSNDALSLPSVVRITFHSYRKLNRRLFTFLQRTCSFLRYLCFQEFCNLGDDLIGDTESTLPTVSELCFYNNRDSIDLPILHRIFSLLPNLVHVTAQQRNITTIDIINNNINVLGRIIKVTIAER
ncbi:unnamed protein product [Adineta steineri]|uniref:Uncharacterized protein n=1 Tax=Adineta steineri TaxID=433720 RepID=A0A818RYY3_9BILA|nr:unnamed protein product [Adineta steineri]